MNQGYRDDDGHGSLYLFPDTGRELHFALSNAHMVLTQETGIRSRYELFLSH